MQNKWQWTIFSFALTANGYKVLFKYKDCSNIHSSKKNMAKPVVCVVLVGLLFATLYVKQELERVIFGSDMMSLGEKYIERTTGSKLIQALFPNDNGDVLKYFGLKVNRLDSNIIVINTQKEKPYFIQDNYLEGSGYDINQKNPITNDPELSQDDDIEFSGGEDLVDYSLGGNSYGLNKKSPTTEDPEFSQDGEIEIIDGVQLVPYNLEGNSDYVNKGKQINPTMEDLELSQDDDIEFSGGEELVYYSLGGNSYYGLKPKIPITEDPELSQDTIYKYEEEEIIQGYSIYCD